MTNTSTTAPSKRTLTDKLCDQAIRRLVKRLEPEYEKTFDHVPAGDAFFAKLEAVDEKITTYLAKRPISKAEILAVGEKVFKHLRAAMREQTKESPQPRYREAISMETGEVRLIPEYD